MRVKELITQLGKYNPDALVRVTSCCYDATPPNIYYDLTVVNARLVQDHDLVLIGQSGEHDD